MAQAAAGVITCPAASQGRPLITVQVFDGDPREQADLDPDGRVWDLRAIRPTSSPAGFFLVCGYGGERRLVLRLPRGVDACRRSGPVRTPRIACR